MIGFRKWKEEGRGDGEGRPEKVVGQQLIPTDLTPFLPSLAPSQRLFCTVVAVVIREATERQDSFGGSGEIEICNPIDRAPIWGK